MQALYRQNAQLIEIARDKLPVLTLADPLFEFMPFTERRTSEVVFEQKDNMGGLTSARGYDGPFGQVKRQGVNVYVVQPGQYGETKEIMESIAVKMAGTGTTGDPMDLRTLQAEDQDHLMSRCISRVLHSGWAILRTGLYQVLYPNGELVTTAQVATRRTTVSDWSDPANGTPLADFRAMMNQYSLGTEFQYGAISKVFMNTVTINQLLANRNVNDLGGYRVLGVGNTVRPMSFEDLNGVLNSQGLPTIVRYDNGWYDDAGQVFNKFIPDREFVWFGSRPDGARPLEWISTINVNGDGQQTPGMKFNTDIKQEPWRLMTSLSLNGAPAIYYATGFVAGRY